MISGKAERTRGGNPRKIGRRPDAIETASPDQPDEIGQDQGEAVGHQDLRDMPQRVRAAQQRRFDKTAQHGQCQGGPDNGREKRDRGHRQPLQSGVAEEGAEHVKRAMCEVQNIHGAEDQRKSRRD